MITKIVHHTSQGEIRRLNNVWNKPSFIKIHTYIVETWNGINQNVENGYLLGQCRLEFYTIFNDNTLIL